MPIRVKMSHCWKSHVAAHILKAEEIAIVEVQRYASDERILVSPKRSNREIENRERILQKEKIK